MSDELVVGATNKVVPISGLGPNLQNIIGMFQKFLGDSGNATFVMTPDVPVSNICIPINTDARVQLPPTLSMTYKKSGDNLDITFTKPPTAIWKMISVEIGKVSINPTQAHIQFNGLAGMLASVTLQAAP